MSNALRILVAGSALLVAGVALWWGLLWALQRSVVFPRPTGIVIVRPSPPPDARVVQLEIDGARVESWVLPPFEGAGEDGPLVIFTHGNGEIIDLWPNELGKVRNFGTLMLVEYPGYGRSGGSPTLESISATMLSAWDTATEELGVAPGRIVLWGRSLGAGASCLLAEQRDVGALILESTFTRAADLARGFGLPSFLLRDPFDNLRCLRGFDGPVLLLHGRHDSIIPPAHAERLHEAAPGSRLEWLDCDHNDCPRPWSAVRRFLRENGLYSS